MPPRPGKRGTRRSLWKRAAAGQDEVSGSSCGAITSVRIPLPHFFAWTLELEPWVSLWSNHLGEEPTTPPLAWASDIWVSLWANRVVEAYFPILPKQIEVVLQFKLWVLTVVCILGAYRLLYVVTPGCKCLIKFLTRSLGKYGTTKSLRPFPSRMVKRGGAYHWSCEKLASGFRVNSPCMGCRVP